MFARPVTEITQARQHQLLLLCHVINAFLNTLKGLEVVVAQVDGKPLDSCM
jgi:hypothetical protein